MNMTVLCSSNSDEWETPPELFELLNEEFDFDFDAAASKETSKVHGNYFGPDHEDPDCRDALTASWTHPAVEASVWLNPPYSQIGPFLAKAVEQKASATIVALLPARTDTAWWWDYVRKADEIRFLKGRLSFLANGKKLSSAPFPSAVAIFRPTEAGAPYCWWWDWKAALKVRAQLIKRYDEENKEAA